MVITISRQYLAGAGPVAEQVANALGWNVLDDGFIEAVAERSGFSMEDVRSLEERVPSFMERFAQSSALSFPEFLLSTPSAIEEPEAVRLAHITRDIIEDIGQRTRTVMVGRAAAAVLASERDAIHVRLVASREHRIRAAMVKHSVSEHEAASIVDERDTNRERYHEEMYGRDWNDPVNYHMVLNTETLGVDAAANLVIAQAHALGW